MAPRPLSAEWRAASCDRAVRLEDEIQQCRQIGAGHHHDIRAFPLHAARGDRPASGRQIGEDHLRSGLDDGIAQGPDDLVRAQIALLVSATSTPPRPVICSTAETIPTANSP